MKYLVSLFAIIFIFGCDKKQTSRTFSVDLNINDDKLEALFTPMNSLSWDGRFDIQINFKYSSQDLQGDVFVRNLIKNIDSTYAIQSLHWDNILEYRDNDSIFANYYPLIEQGHAGGVNYAIDENSEVQSFVELNYTDSKVFGSLQLQMKVDTTQTQDSQLEDVLFIVEDFEYDPF